ncbi:MAG: hypothetical protein MOB07_15655 [Acidobacteria bacterium]|nr:hypothetical protein [Acidobacteriota bacterium]
MMPNHRRRITRSGKATSWPSKAGNLKEQLKQLSSDQLVEIVEKFLTGLSEKQRLEFLNLLPSVKSQDLEVHLPYDSDEDFFAEIEDFCERVRSEEFVEYGAGYDPEEGTHHGFGDDSWIGEMDELFETAELYFLAHHYDTVEKAYQLLFDCLMIQSRDGGFYFTTSDPQGALKTDLIKARQHYFDALRHLYTGSELAERIIDGIGEYRYIGRKPPEIQELFPKGGEVIQLLETSLIKMPSRDEASTILQALDHTAEQLRQIYTHFRSLEELDRFAEAYGEKHPWAYEDLVQAYARKKNWQKVFYWADRGLSGKGSKKKERNAILADYKARAAEQLGDKTAMLGSLWDAFNNEANVDRYVALRKAAIASGQWKTYYPRIIRRLTHNLSRSSYTLGQLWDNRLLVEALLAEGEYERALEQASRSDYSSWDEKGDARKSVVDFFLQSVTRSTGKDVYTAKYPEIARRLGTPAEFIKRLGEELFQESLSEEGRDRQIDWIVQIVKPRIDQIVSGKRQRVYADAARDAKFIVELYLFQGQGDKAKSFIAGLHTQYQRHRNFRTELKNLGLV